jgi:hypothetical protein
LDFDILDIVGFDDKKLYFNITQNHDESKNGLIIQAGELSEKEKGLYEQIIKQLKDENGYLKKILDSYVK